MAGRAGHRDRRYGVWWIWLAAAFVVALGVIFVFPFLTSPQPEQVLETPPTSITEANSTNNQSEQSAEEPNNQPIEDEVEITRPQ
jgi:cytoskeletal protein RodZ